MPRLVRVTFEQKLLAVLLLLPGAAGIAFLVDDEGSDGAVVAAIMLAASGIYFGVVWLLQLRHDLRVALGAVEPADGRVEPGAVTVVRALVKALVLNVLANLATSAIVAAALDTGSVVWERLVLVPWAAVTGIGALALFAAVRIDRWQRIHARLLLRAPAWGLGLDPRRLAYVEAGRDEGELPVIAAPRD